MEKIRHAVCFVADVPELGEHPEIDSGDFQAVFLDFVRADSNIALDARCTCWEVECLMAFAAFLPEHAVAYMVTTLPASGDHVVSVNGDIHDSFLTVNFGGSLRELEVVNSACICVFTVSSGKLVCDCTRVLDPTGAGKFVNVPFLPVFEIGASVCEHDVR